MAQVHNFLHSAKFRRLRLSYREQILKASMCVHLSTLHVISKQYLNTLASQCCTGWHVPSSPWTRTVVYSDPLSCCHKYREPKVDYSVVESSPQQMQVIVKTTATSCQRKFTQTFSKWNYIFVSCCFFLPFSSVGTNGQTDSREVRKYWQTCTLFLTFHGHRYIL